MNPTSSISSAPNQALSKHQERAGRILDAAAELILRWGYDKTTIDDICKKADVAKGTIYLHWKTRDDLFETLVRRESMEMLDDFKRRVASDPEGATLRGMYKHAALALMKRPILKAFFLGDREILGRLARQEHNHPVYEKRLAGFYVYLDFLRKEDLIRTDISYQAAVYGVTAIFSGYFMLSPLVPESLKLGDEEIAQLIGETIHRTFETGREISADKLVDISKAFLQYLDEIQKNSEAQLQEMLKG